MIFSEFFYKWGSKHVLEFFISSNKIMLSKINNIYNHNKIYFAHIISNIGLLHSSVTDFNIWYINTKQTF